MDGSPFFIRGGVSVAIGTLAMVWPGPTHDALISVFGVYAILDGVSNLLHGLTETPLRDRSRPKAAQGIFGVAAGTLACLWPGMSTLMLVVLIGTWAMAMGVFEITEAVRLRHYLTGEWLLALSGLMSVLFALVLFAVPAGGALAIAWLLGTYAVAMGVAFVALGMRIQSDLLA